MKQKRKNQKQEDTPRFGGKIRQMKTSKMVLINFTDVEPFAQECAKRGITLGVGSAYNGSVIMYEKKK